MKINIEFVSIINDIASIIIGGIIGLMLSFLYDKENPHDPNLLIALIIFSVIILIFTKLWVFHLRKKNTSQKAKVFRDERDYYYNGRNFLIENLLILNENIVTQPNIVSSDIHLKKEEDFVTFINKTLNDLCDMYSSIVDGQKGLTKAQQAFTSSYSIVKGEQLIYKGFRTLDGSPPKSMTIGKTYKIGEGLAGLAWQSQLPTVEDNFSDSYGFKPNYEGQEKKYQSMISIPVFSNQIKANYSIIGVVTICSYIDDFFGHKVEQNTAREHNEKMKPFIKYLGFITEIYNLKYR